MCGSREEGGSEEEVRMVVTSKSKIIHLDGGRMAFLDGLKQSTRLTSGQPEGNMQTMLIRKEVAPVVVMFGSDNGKDAIDLGPYEGLAEVERGSAMKVWVTPEVQRRMVADLDALADAVKYEPIRDFSRDIANVDTVGDDGRVFVGGLFDAMVKRSASWPLWASFKWQWEVEAEAERKKVIPPRVEPMEH
jgi:hypothetical protein